MRLDKAIVTGWCALWLSWALVTTGAAQAQGLTLDLGLPGGSKTAAVVKTDQVRAELWVHAPQGVAAGRTFWLGLHIEHQPHWHTYWQNPGDSGLPTQLRWKLPSGLQAGEIAWPLPKKIPIGTLANYGYEGRLLLPVPVQVPPQAALPTNGLLDIELQAEWLVCRQECIPQEGLFRVQLPVRSASALHSADFEAAAQTQIKPLPGAHQAQIVEGGQALRLRVVDLPSAWRGQTLSLFPETANVVLNAARLGAAEPRWAQSWQGGVWTAQVPVSHERSDSPSQMRWLLARGDALDPQGPGLSLVTPLQGHWPPTAKGTGEVSPALAQALQANASAAAPSSHSTPNPANAVTLVLALLGAMLGGLMLNLMPCVFPVLAIKVLGFSRPGTHLRQHRAAGLAYTAGVVLSFVALGAAMLVLRAAGEQLGWGFQLQSPGAVAALAVLFTVLGLNLAGWFEFGQMLPSALASLQVRHPVVDAALSGALAVAIASPCTAPFMGASLGLAIGLPLWQALPVFAAMGVGMALPYLAASWWPGLAHRLPRPGAWMLGFRQAMAFPMFATVVWLLWVLGQQSGNDAASLLLASLLAMAFVIWALRLNGKARWAMTLLALGLLGALASRLPQRLSGAETTALTSPTVPSAARWQPWSQTTAQQHLASGKTVFVDFTAAWCVTCQYNKASTLSDPQVLAAFDAAQVVTLRADWTRRDAAITRALTALGRSGVPVYAVFRPGQSPVLLSELPSVAEVLSALR